MLALAALLLAQPQNHEALRFCSDKEAAKKPLFTSYWKKCSVKFFNQFGVADLGNAAKIANRLAIQLAFRNREGLNRAGNGIRDLSKKCAECLEPLRGIDRRPFDGSFIGDDPQLDAAAQRMSDGDESWPGDEATWSGAAHLPSALNWWMADVTDEPYHRQWHDDRRQRSERECDTEDPDSLQWGTEAEAEAAAAAAEAAMGKKGVCFAFLLKEACKWGVNCRRQDADQAAAAGGARLAAALDHARRLGPALSAGGLQPKPQRGRRL